MCDHSPVWFEGRCLRNWAVIGRRDRLHSCRTAGEGCPSPLPSLASCSQSWQTAGQIDDAWLFYSAFSSLVWIFQIVACVRPYWRLHFDQPHRCTFVDCDQPPNPPHSVTTSPSHHQIRRLSVDAPSYLVRTFASALYPTHSTTIHLCDDSPRRRPYISLSPLPAPLPTSVFNGLPQLVVPQYGLGRPYT